MCFEIWIKILLELSIDLNHSYYVPLVSYHKNYCEKIATSPECFVCFWCGFQIWKEQSFNLTVGIEGITKLRKSNFEQSKSKWRHQCHIFAKKGIFFNMACSVWGEKNKMKSQKNLYWWVLWNKNHGSKGISSSA